MDNILILIAWTHCHIYSIILYHLYLYYHEKFTNEFYIKNYRKRLLAMYVNENGKNRKDSDSLSISEEFLESRGTWNQEETIQ